jgi:hypothetical protein
MIILLAKEIEIDPSSFFLTKKKEIDYLIKRQRLFVLPHGST